MQTIYSDGKYNIKANTKTGKVVIGNGKASMEKELGKITDNIPKYIRDFLIENKLSPENYLFIRSGGFTIRAGAKKAWNQALSQFEVNKTAQKRQAHEKLLSNVPGLDVLQTAHQELDQYQDAFSRAMEDEYNDGVNMPMRPDHDTEALAIQYPVAALYLRAESYSNASNTDKYSAGMRALKIITDGGSAEEAANILDNWLPKSAIWN